MGRAPFLRMALLLSLGIVVYLVGFRLGSSGAAILFLVSIIYCSLYFSHRYYPTDSKSVGLSLSGDVICVLFGILICTIKDPLRHSNHLLYHDQSVEAYSATVLNSPQRKPYGFRAEVEVNKVWKGGNTYKVQGRMYVSFRDSTAVVPLPGTQFVVLGHVQRIEGTALEGMFDFPRYAAYQRIFHQSTVKAGEWHITDTVGGYAILRAAGNARMYTDSILRQYLRTVEAKGMLSALLLGVKDNLSEEMKTTFGDTGAIHVLAVSGLHVGILFMLVMVLIKPFEKRKAILRTGLAIAIVVLWAYAFITGLSASVLRSVLMFSVVLVGQLLGRKGYVLNGLAISALILLCYEPHYLTSVGFQLSYLAVLGIVWLQPMLARLWEPESKWLRYMWDLTCVSVAAQAATCVLGVYYFHQFPVYFLLSNWIVIPVAGFLLITGFALVLLSWIPGVGIVCALLLDGTIWAMHKTLKGLASLPYSTLEPLYLNGTEVVLLLIVLAGIMSFFSTQQRAYIWMSLFASIAFSGYRIPWLYTNQSSNSIRLSNSMGSLWITSPSAVEVSWYRWKGTYSPSENDLAAHAAALARKSSAKVLDLSSTTGFVLGSNTWLLARSPADLLHLELLNNPIVVIERQWKGKVALPDVLDYTKLTIVLETGYIPFAWRQPIGKALAQGATLYRLHPNESISVPVYR